MSSTNPTSPGDLLRDVLHHRGTSPDEFAGAAKIPLSEVEGILAGTMKITAEHAEKFERILNSTADFWLRHQAAYEKHLVTKKIATPEGRAELAASMVSPKRGFR